MSDCIGCGAPIDCPDDNSYVYTLTGDPTLPYFFFCPAANCLPPFQGGGGGGSTGGLTPGTPTTPTCGPVFLVCCSHQITRQVCSNTTPVQLAAILTSMLAECDQYAGECNDPPCTPPCLPPVQQQQWFFSAAKTCTVTCPDGTAFLGTARAGLFMAPTQAAADAQAQAYACTQANNLKRCDGSLDMPLDQAVYVPAVGARAAFIAAVRGSYIFALNATTGAKISSVRFTYPGLADSSIAYDSINDRIWVSHWSDYASGDGVQTHPTMAFFRIVPASLAVEGIVGPTALFGSDSIFSRYAGPHQIIIDSGVIFGMAVANNTGGQQPFRYTIATGAVVGNAAFGDFFNVSWAGLGLSNGELWLPSGDEGRLHVADPATILEAGASPYAMGRSVYDLCFNPANGRGYLTTGTAVIKRVSSAHAVLADLTLPGTNPYVLRIRYNPNDALIYAPDTNNNKIFVIDPATDTVTATKTGFDSPFDCVFTPASAGHPTGQKWAIQRGPQGIKEII